jgi:hypothetical protein
VVEVTSLVSWNWRESNSQRGVPSIVSFVSLLAHVPNVRFSIVGCLFTARKTNSSHVRRVAVTTWHAIRSKGVNARFMYLLSCAVQSRRRRTLMIFYFDFNAVVSTFRDWFRRIRANWLASRFCPVRRNADQSQHSPPVCHEVRLTALVLYGMRLFLSLSVNPLKTKRRPLYLKIQSVPRCKHFSSRL